MKYRLIKVYSTICPDRFYRLMYVREDLNLQEAGVFILYSLGAAFEHMFLYEAKGITYVDETWLEDALDEHQVQDYTEVTIENASYNDDGTLNLVYDTGEYWEFVIQKTCIEKEIDDEIAGWCLEMAGYPIWEDHISAFSSYIETGEADFERYGYPWNVRYPNHDLKCFDKTLRVSAHNKNLAKIDIKTLVNDLFSEDY